jgi:hypothetical protein
MEQQLATEAQTDTAPETAAKAAARLETWATNERMRHVPSVEWLLWKVDADLRVRLEKLLAPVTAEVAQRPEIQADLRQICRAFERLADVAKHARPSNHVNGELAARVTSSLNLAVNSLRALEPSLIGRRFPFHTFERSKAEPLYGALLLAIDATARLTAHIRAIDRHIDERLLHGLVTLQNPVDDRMLRPIVSS